MKLSHTLLLLASILTLAGCGLTGDLYPTPIPSDIIPTAIYQTAAAANATMFALTPSATVTPLPTLTFTPTFTFTPTVTTTPTGVPPAPNAKIFVAAPGPMSKVASPMQVRMEVVAGEDQLVEISLFGEDGRLIARTLERVLAQAPLAAYLSPEIRFEIRAAELGHLQVVTKDRFGRIESISNTFLLLLPVGQSEITPAPPPFERAYFSVPVPEAIIAGGVLRVEGSIWPLNDTQPILIELRDENHKIISEKLLSITGDTYMPFSVEFLYKVTEVTPIRMSIYQTDPRIDGIVYLFSQIITIAP